MQNNTLVFLEIAAKGTRDFGNIRLGPYFYWISGNYWEGARFRFDAATNKGFSKKWNFSGYLAYGTKDGLFKGKAQAKYLLNKDPWTFLAFSYKSDIDNRQFYYDQLGNDNIFATVFRRMEIPFKFQQIKETKLEFFKETGSGYIIELAAIDKQYKALMNLPGEELYKTTRATPTDLTNPFHSFETVVKLRYAFQERYLEENFNRRSLGSKQPIVELKYTKGWAGVFNSNNNYDKIDITISHKLSVAPYGKLYWNLFAGKVYGTVPYQFLDILPGNELYYYNKYAFNLMNQFEFLADNYAGFNIEHNIGNGLFRFIPLTRKLMFRQFWSVKGVIGSLSDANKKLNFIGNYPYKSLDDRMYLEVGTGIDNILKFFRLDLVWRLSDHPTGNAVVNKFGVFGSFRFTF